MDKKVLFIFYFIFSTVYSQYGLIDFRGGETPDVWTLGDNAPVGTYNYVPSVMLDGDYRVWWCAGHYGDTVYYSQSSSLDNSYLKGWATPVIVLGPSHVNYTFDEQGSCDPNVIRYEDRLYLYYGGIGRNHHDQGYFETALGAAVSDDDGKSFTRLNKGEPIVTTVGNRNNHNLYGAGQPSVIYHPDGYLYMAYTDTGGNDPQAEASSGNCVYMIRSQDPSFTSGVEDWLGWGKSFTPTQGLSTRARHALCCNCASIDWVFSVPLQVWIMGFSTTFETHQVIQVFIFDVGFNGRVDTLTITGSHTEGPGIAHTPSGNAPANPSSIGTTAVDMMRSVGNSSVWSWKLAHIGATLTGPMKQNDAGAIFDGYIVSSTGNPECFVTDGSKICIQEPLVINRLSRNVIELPLSVYQSIPMTAELLKGATAYSAPGRPGAFLLSNKLFPVSCAGIVSDNGSSLEQISDQRWDSYLKGPSLYCIVV